MSLIGFEKSMPVVLTFEGGYSNNPKDPGGATFQGITQRAYDGARVMNNLPKQDVREMASRERNAIYQHFYWDAVFGDVQPLGIDFLMFDAAVNSGPQHSIAWLQIALGETYTGKLDGWYGPVTAGAISEWKDYDILALAMVGARRAFLHSLSTYVDFGKGWDARLDTALATAQAWASGSVGPVPAFTEGGNVKTPHPSLWAWLASLVHPVSA